jgi:hypothetical protein
VIEDLKECNNGFGSESQLAVKLLRKT